MAMKARMPGGARHTITSLQVMAKAWTARLLWSTIRASDGAKGGPSQSFGAGGVPLPSQAVAVSTKLWKTVHGAGNVDKTGKLGSGGEFAKQANRRMETFRSTHQDQTTSTTGNTSSTATQRWHPPLSGRLQLNPLFVEWLMGLPIGSTCVCAPEQSASRRWATRSYNNRQHGHISSFFSDLEHEDAA
jgi:hypothetical protein